MNKTKYTDKHSDAKQSNKKSTSLILYRIAVYLVTVVLVSCAVILRFCIYNVGSDSTVALQMPAKSFTAADLHAVENSDDIQEGNQYVQVSFLNNSYSMRVSQDKKSYENMVFNLVIPEEDDITEYTDITEFTEDGSQNWINGSQVTLRLLPTVESDSLGTLDIGDEVIRISYGTNWSYVRTNDLNGFVLTSYLTDVKPEPTPVPSPTPTPTSTPTPVPVEASVPEPTSTPVPTATPEPTATPVPVVEEPEVIEEVEVSEIIFTETECDLNLFASCALNVRTGPDISFDLSYVLDSNTPIHVIAQTDNGWYKLEDGNYVKASLTIEKVPEATTSTNNSGITVGNDFGNYCLSFVGTAYVYAGSSPSGFDCSGLVQYVMANYYGISLPHNADSISQLGTAVNADSVLPGDILCHDYDGDGYIDHVSIYIGDGLCVHASNSRSGVITSSFPMGSVVTIRRFV